MLDPSTVSHELTLYLILLSCLCLSHLCFYALHLQPACAQFGVAGGRRQAGTNFEELQELAKKKAATFGGGDSTADMEKLMREVMNDPNYLETMGKMGQQFGGALQEMMKLSPDEMAAQMKQAMQLMSEGDIVENVVNQRDEVLKSLEASGMVPPEELAKYKADPNYFEQQMRASFSQMSELFGNEEYLSKAAEIMKGMGDLMNDPDLMQNMMGALGTDWQDDGKIEEARVKFLAGDFGGVPGFKEAFETDEMQEILKDPVKWRETVKEGFSEIVQGGGLAGVKDEL
jgi:hypothetical protein